MRQTEVAQWGVWVSGIRGRWLPDPLKPLTPFKSQDRNAAQLIVDMQNSGGKGPEAFMVARITDDDTL